MGGHSSKQSVSQTTNLVASAVTEQIQNCAGTVTSSNELDIGNVYDSTVRNISQISRASYDANCVTSAVNDVQFLGDVSNQVAQQLENKGVALTGWADAGKTTQVENVNNNIQVSAKSTNEQNCAVAASSGNVALIHDIFGSTVADIKQMSLVSAISRCAQNGEQSLQASASVSNASAQHLENVEENPLSFIGDFLQGLFGSMAMGVVVLLVFLVAIAFVFKLAFGGGGGEASDAEGDSSPAAQNVAAAA